jgi:chromate transporter
MDLNAIGESFMQRLLELAGLFVRSGTTAFGGPAAHVAMVENEVVRLRQ